MDCADRRLPGGTAPPPVARTSGALRTARDPALRPRAPDEGSKFERPGEEGGAPEGPISRTVWNVPYRRGSPAPRCARLLRDYFSSSLRVSVYRAGADAYRPSPPSHASRE